ncbi:unnamed protein product, partial [Amoebophrya sp. A25]
NGQHKPSGLTTVENGLDASYFSEKGISLPQYSPGRAYELWHVLTKEWSWRFLLILELTLEILLILVFSLLVLIAGRASIAAENDTEREESFDSLMLVAFN